MPWYLLADDTLYKAERTINAPGWSLDETTPRDQPVHGWTWYDTDDVAMEATGLVGSLTARLDSINPPITPKQAMALGRPNNQAATTAERNRLDKVILRRQAKQDAAIALLTRLIDPALRADVSDTADA